MDAADSIVVDWGSSNFRAYRFGPDGAIADQRAASAGILSVPDRAFEAALEREIGDWIGPGSEVWLSGMITSRNGWVETPYAEAPAGLEALARGAVSATSRRGARLRFLPGVAQRAPLPDVMRGEEIQVFGSVGAEKDAVVVLPGTHSKWVRVEQGRIVAFRTFLTGESYALLKGHSIVGRLIPEGGVGFDEAAFLEGVALANRPGSAGLLNDVFTARSGALLGGFGAETIADRLSGIVIGHELRGGLGLGWQGGPLRLVGEAGLCARYRAALAELGEPAVLGPAHAAVEGFRLLGALAGATA